MAPRYSPGYVVSSQAQEVSDALLGADGWIDAYAMQNSVQQALQNAGMGVRPIGQDSGAEVVTGGSFDIKKWDDLDVNGQPLTVIAGQWDTYLSSTPSEILQQLTAAQLPLEQLAQYCARVLTVRYWTERYARLNKPGGFYLGLTVYHAPAPGSTGVLTEEHVAKRARILSTDFLHTIHGSS